MPQEPMMPPMQQMPPMPAKPMSRRARWGQKMRTGVAMITNSLPDWFATYAFATYMVALVGVNIFFAGRGTEWYFWLFGIAWVAGFFYLSVKYSREWSILKVHKAKTFEKKLFWTGFGIRALYVLISYNFYIAMTGQPYEFGYADSLGYTETAQWFSAEWSGDNLWHTLAEFGKSSFSDMGYPLFILLPIHIFRLSITRTAFPSLL